MGMSRWDRGLCDWASFYTVPESAESDTRYGTAPNSEKKKKSRRLGHLSTELTQSSQDMEEKTRKKQFFQSFLVHFDFKKKVILIYRNLRFFYSKEQYLFWK